MSRAILRATALTVCALSVACQGPQSMLGTNNPGGQSVEGLWWIALASTGFLSTVVILALAYAVVRAGRAGRSGPDHPAPDVDGIRRESSVILLAGALGPAIFLIGFLTLSVDTGQEISRPPSAPTLTVEVVGHMFWWEIRYPEAGVVTANELHIPAGETVAVQVSSADVIHSFWIPQLSPGKIDMVPGRTNLTWMLADEPGTYRGQCTEFCGTQHALMSMRVVASPPEDFERWLDRRTQPPEVPSDLELRRGLSLFSQHGCDACHRIRDVTPLDLIGTAGPDLTDVGARSTLGALAVENTPETLGRWILNPHIYKPGVRMPPTDLSEEDLAAMVAYLRSLDP